MEIKLDNLNLPKEKRYFIILAILASIFWIFIALSIVGLVIALLIALFSWFANGLLVAHLRSSCVRVTDKQMPELFGTFKDVCEKFNIPVPELYVLQANGMLNAFAYRHSGRDFVVLFSDLIEGFDPKGDEVRFLLGHEIAHLKSKHIAKQIFLLPASWFPLVGTAYHRACESSSDRYGAFSVTDIDGAIKVLLRLAGGKNLYQKMDAATFLEQATVHRGFFVSWYELMSGYPTLSQRVANLSAIKNKQMEPTYDRHPLSYVFAFFSVQGFPQAAGVFMMFFVIMGLLSAIAIPNLIRAKRAADNAAVQSSWQVPPPPAAGVYDNGGMGSGEEVVPPFEGDPASDMGNIDAEDVVSDENTEDPAFDALPEDVPQEESPNEGIVP